MPVVQSYIVILDTNALYTKDDRKLFNTKLTETFSAIRNTPCVVSLYIPRVSFMEHLFKKAKAATEKFHAAEKTVEFLSNLTNYQMGIDTKCSVFQRKLFKEALKWSKTHNIKIVRTPHKEINWNSVVRKSIYRLPPFSPYEPSESKEKGFRDALILETVAGLMRTFRSGPLVFISGDKLLRESVMNHRDKHNQVYVFEDVGSFETRVKLIAANFSESFSDLVTSAAPLAFYNPATMTGLFIDGSIAEKLKAISQWNFEHRIEQWLSKVNMPVKQIAHLTEVSITVGYTTFSSYGTDERYHWTTEINRSAIVEVGEFAERIFIQSFFCLWNCLFSEEGQPKDVRLDGFDGGFLSSGPVSDAVAKRFGLPTTEERNYQMWLDEWAEDEQPDNEG